MALGEILRKAREARGLSVADVASATHLMSRQIDLPLKSITIFLGNVHIYQNNVERTRQLLKGDDTVKFDLNV